MTDEEKIRQMQALWSEKDADKDAVGLSELYTEDGKYVSRRGELVGREAIRKDLEHRTAVAPPNRNTMHIFGPPVIKIDGDTAESVSAYVAYGRIGDDPWAVMTIGRFHCKLARRGDGWLFTEVANRAIGTAGGPSTSQLEKQGQAAAAAR
jgi:ketosteroid isomerase-like protein